MKKNIIIATIAVASAFILSVSCQKQEISVSENTNDSEIVAFSATINQESTKTVLVAGSDVNKFKVNWESTDKISIKGAEYTVSSIKDDATKAIFSGNGAIKEDSKYKAIYPSSLYKTDHFELPSIQTYAAGKFNAPMYAESETESLAFKNICGVLCLSLKGDSNDKIKYITVIANEGVCGKFTMGNDATTLSLSSTAGEYSRTVSLDCGEGVQLDNTTATNFYIYLPPNTYTAGMKIIITTTDSRVFEKITAASATIERNNIYTFNNWTLDFKVKPTLLSGEFTVADGKTVKFTRGNLWADASGDKASAPELHFETSQYGFNSDYSDNSHVSYFSWSSTVLKAVGTTNDGNNLFCDETNKKTVDAQSNCYALSQAEWNHLFTERTGAENKYGYATVNNIHGIIILPDGTFNEPYAGIKTFKSNSTAGWTANEYTEAEWIAMESAGAVFLPAAGGRNGSSVYDIGVCYWSSTAIGSLAYYLYYNGGSVFTNSNDSRSFGFSLRLVKAAAAPTPAGSEYVEMNMGTGQTAYKRKWATMNLGATTVAGNLATCAGDYYAWAETEPYYGTLSWSGVNVTFSNWEENKTSGYMWQSYCSNDSFEEWSTLPYNETSKILKAEKDAATENLGNGWRMPTSQEFKDLFDACGGGTGDFSTYASTFCNETTSFTKGVFWCGNYDGVAGLLFCDGTNKLFFPATGRCYGTAISSYKPGETGYYWSSDLSVDISKAAILYFYIGSKASGYRLDQLDRCLGCAIRPVLD